MHHPAADCLGLFIVLAQSGQHPDRHSIPPPYTLDVPPCVVVYTSRFLKPIRPGSLIQSPHRLSLSYSPLVRLQARDTFHPEHCTQFILPETPAYPTHFHIILDWRGAKGMIVIRRGCTVLKFCVDSSMASAGAESELLRMSPDQHNKTCV